MNTKKALLTTISVLCITILIHAQLPSYVPTNGLVAWYPFNGNANDESGNGNNGTVNGAMLTTDRFGTLNKAYSFDGFGDSIVSVLPSMQNYSFNTWIECSAMPSDYPCIYNFKTALQNNRLLLLGSAYSLADRGKIFLGDDNDATNNYQSTFTVNDKKWRMLSIIYNYAGGTLNLYVDNNLITTKSIIGSSNFGGKMKIGNGFSQFTSGNPAYDSKGFVGNIDDIGIWNRALTQQEITKLFTSGNTNTKEIIGKTDFNVFPNPASNQINVRSNIFLINDEYTLTDLLGKTISSGKILNENTTIEIENLSKGLYFLNVGGDVRKQTFKIVKE